MVSTGRQTPRHRERRKIMRCDCLSRHSTLFGRSRNALLCIRESRAYDCPLRVRKFFVSSSNMLTKMLSDTRALLCATDGGQVHPMTEVHHADGRVESARLRRMMGSSLITDSYGESR